LHAKAHCSAHWAAANPPPEFTVWAAINDPDERLRIALSELYAFYERTEAMLDNLFTRREHDGSSNSASAPSMATSKQPATRSCQAKASRQRPQAHTSRRRPRDRLCHLEIARPRTQLNNTEAAALAHAFVTAARR